MISKIKGKLVRTKDNIVEVEVNDIFYDILMPKIILNSISKDFNLNDEITLVTFHYYQIMPSRSIPILVGFTNEIEKEFFIQIISVSGIGPKVAVKALDKPISYIAHAIDKADVKMLSALPGIGKRKAREIIAKLQGKIGKFGLVQDQDIQEDEMSISEDIKKEAINVLLQLRYKKHEAKRMINKALKEDSNLSSVEDILNHVYKRKK